MLEVLSGYDGYHERTALSPEANDDVEKLGITDRGNGNRWEKAINDYLEKFRNSRKRTRLFFLA